MWFNTSYCCWTWLTVITADLLMQPNTSFLFWKIKHTYCRSVQLSIPCVFCFPTTEMNSNCHSSSAWRLYRLCFLCQLCVQFSCTLVTLHRPDCRNKWGNMAINRKTGGLPSPTPPPSIPPPTGPTRKVLTLSSLQLVCPALFHIHTHSMNPYQLTVTFISYYLMSKSL